MISLIFMLMFMFVALMIAMLVMMLISKKHVLKYGIGLLVLCAVVFTISAGMSVKQWIYLMPNGRCYFRNYAYFVGDSTNYDISSSTDIATEKHLKFAVRISSGDAPIAEDMIGIDEVDGISILYISTSTNPGGWVKVGGQ